ncbi:unnamed protein product [Vitrella brassicaformis CCMP3155]|uniref:RRM domain-containing protein n=2 Tax=Vitrella brassicaformis TaxID=1169539 RepID=A0A0G4GEN5_VITBC|nr:unnamed protein product [Vitrella brassicaformis CCMP3155]|eukprot:CEM27810.1 unnamed protein product [Vitrella brassicaformis CCMP3155]
MPSDVSDEEIRKAAEEWGDIKNFINISTKGMAFIEYFDLRAAEEARKGLKAKEFGGKSIDAQFSSGRPDGGREENQGTLFVRPATADRNFIDINSVEQYRELFTAFGAVKKVTPNRKREAEKFVQYFDLRDAEKALKGLNGFNFNGVLLDVQFSNQPSRSLNRDSKIHDLISRGVRIPKRPDTDYSYSSPATASMMMPYGAAAMPYGTMPYMPYAAGGIPMAGMAAAGMPAAAGMAAMGSMGYGPMRGSAQAWGQVGQMPAAVGGVGVAGAGGGGAATATGTTATPVDPYTYNPYASFGYGAGGYGAWAGMYDMYGMAGQQQQQQQAAAAQVAGHQQQTTVPAGVAAAAYPATTATYTVPTVPTAPSAAPAPAPVATANGQATTQPTAEAPNATTA